MKEEAMKEEFDYSRLLGKIVEKFNTREKHHYRIIYLLIKK